MRSSSMSDGIGSGVKANVAKGTTGSIGTGAADSKREESLQVGRN